MEWLARIPQQVLTGATDKDLASSRSVLVRKKAQASQASSDSPHLDSVNLSGG